MNKQLLAAFMLDGGAEDFISPRIPIENLDPFEVEILWATAGVHINYENSTVLIIPNADKSSVFCVKKTKQGLLKPIDYKPSWEELSDILEKMDYTPSWRISGEEDSPTIKTLIKDYINKHSFLN